MGPVARVFITRAFPFEALKRLQAEHEVDVWDENTPPPREALLEHAATADALLTIITERVDAELFDAAPSVKAVANLAVGTDNIDLDEAAKRGIPVGNTPGVLTDATADIAFALLLGIARRIAEGDRQVREGEWEPWYPTHMIGGDTTGMTLGIVGWGRIGQAMARRGEGFGMEVIHHSRSSGVPLDELLERADYVSLHTPLTADTRHLIGAPELRRMKPTAYLINTARGPIVDEAALIEALRKKTIAGAGLDVYDIEPLPLDHALRRLDNVVLSPHLGYVTQENFRGSYSGVVEDIRAFLDGKPIRLLEPA
ncbi:MAG: glyoxylate reductase [Alphaproteobacteria bacterium]|nr:glyoxylate reductase [Alphaproteobacteria bacterium]